MKKPLVTLYQDVEDPIHPLADDAALDLARLFTEAGVRGSFCITGEKCRTLLARGRHDVLEAFRPHCLGLHTDTHSFHPTTMELLADLEFEAGCQAAYETEKRGFDAFVAAFGRSPAFWGGAGNTWSPEISSALQKLGIPAYSYALTEVPGRRPHRFNGVMALSQDRAISEPEWADDAVAKSRSEALLAELASTETPYLGVFVGHPTRFRYSQFWDVPYAGGRTPESPELVEPLPDETYERSKRNLASFLGQLSSVATVVGVDEVLAMPWSYAPLDAEGRAVFEDRTAANIRDVIRWPTHRPGLDPEGIIRKTLALGTSVEMAELAQDRTQSV